MTHHCLSLFDVLSDYPVLWIRPVMPPWTRLCAGPCRRVHPRHCRRCRHRNLDLKKYKYHPWYQKKKIKKIDAPKDDGKLPSNLVATVMIADIKYCHPVVKVVHDHLDNAFKLISLCRFSTDVSCHLVGLHIYKSDFFTRVIANTPVPNSDVHIALTDLVRFIKTQGVSSIEAKINGPLRLAEIFHYSVHV